MKDFLATTRVGLSISSAIFSLSVLYLFIILFAAVDPFLKGPKEKLFRFVGNSKFFVFLISCFLHMISGGNDEDRELMQNVSLHSHIIIALILGVLADVCNHRITLLLVSLATMITAYYWTDFYGTGTLSTLCFIDFLLVFPEEVILLVRSFLLEAPGFYDIRGRWFVRTAFLQMGIQAIIPYLSKFYLPVVNDFFFPKADRLPTSVGWYLLAVGIIFLVLAVYPFKTIRQLKDAESLDTKRGYNSNRKRDEEADDHSAEGEKLLSNNQTQITTSATQEGNSASQDSGIANSTIYFLFLSFLVLLLHFLFSLSVFLFQDLLIFLLKYQFKIDQPAVDIILRIAAALGLLQLGLLERIMVRQEKRMLDASYELIMMGCVLFLFFVWCLIESEHLLSVFYSSSASKLSFSDMVSRSAHTPPPENYPIEEFLSQSTGKLAYQSSSGFQVIQVGLLICALILIYSFSVPMQNVMNLIVYSSIPLPKKYSSFSSFHGIRQGFHRVVTTLSVICYLWIIRERSLQLNEEDIEDLVLSGDSSILRTSVKFNLGPIKFQRYFLILFCLSLEFVLLLVFHFCFKDILRGSVSVQRNISQQEGPSNLYSVMMRAIKKVSLKKWMLIGFGCFGMVYSLMFLEIVL
jgi:hypothetical protein